MSIPPEAILLTLALALPPSTAPAELQPAYSVEEEWARGGDLNYFLHAIKPYRQPGTRVSIELRECLSACTYWLLAHDVCVAPGTMFGFHGPSRVIVEAGAITVDLEPDPETVAIMARTYNRRWPGLGDWFKAHAAHRVGRDLVMVSGADLYFRYGIPLCL